MLRNFNDSKWGVALKSINSFLLKSKLCSLLICSIPGGTAVRRQAAKLRWVTSSHRAVVLRNLTSAYRTNILTPC